MPVTADPGRVVITVRGDLDMASSPSFLAGAMPRLGREPLVEVVIDMTDAGFVGSTGLGALIEVRNAAHALGATTRLRGADRRVTRLLHVVGLDRAFLTGPPVDEPAASV